MIGNHSSGGELGVKTEALAALEPLSGGERVASLDGWSGDRLRESGVPHWVAYKHLPAIRLGSE